MGTKHLDIGCGGYPRNPYFQDEIFGLDQSNVISDPRISTCQLGLDSFPFASDYFDSVSAYDFLEHIPRQAIDYTSRKINFPFVYLMQEVWRVLKPEGKFFALTPVYPGREVFQDPTHVNFITENTHSYFCGPAGTQLYCSHYGFTGRFEALNVRHVFPEEITGQGRSSWKFRWKKFRRVHLQRKPPTHLFWELVAKK